MRRGATYRSPASSARPLPRADDVGRKSTIQRLPASVRDEIRDLREAGHTIDEILAQLRGLGDNTVSRSALGRHVKQLDVIGEEIRRSREIAEVLVRQYGEAPAGKTARMNIAFLQSAVNRILVSEDGEMARLDPKEVAALTQALKNLGQAAKADVELAAQERRVFAKKAADTAVKAVEDELTGADRPLPPEALKRIREQVYGIYDERTAAGG